MHKHHSHKHSATPAKQKYSFGDFVPLIVIFLAILLLTLILSLRGGEPELTSVLRNFMGVFFLVFGFFKVINLRGFADAYQVYDLIAKRSRVYAYLYPFIELSLGFAYLFSFFLLVTNWITLVIMTVSALGVYLKLREKEVVPCACLGTVFKIPMTWVTLGEDLLMAFMALGMIVYLT